MACNFRPMLAILFCSRGLLGGMLYADRPNAQEQNNGAVDPGVAGAQQMVDIVRNRIQQQAECEFTRIQVHFQLPDARIDLLRASTKNLVEDFVAKKLKQETNGSMISLFILRPLAFDLSESLARQLNSEVNNEELNAFLVDCRAREEFANDCSRAVMIRNLDSVVSLSPTQRKNVEQILRKHWKAAWCLQPILMSDYLVEKRVLPEPRVAEVLTEEQRQLLELWKSGGDHQDRMLNGDVEPDRTKEFRTQVVECGQKYLAIRKEQLRVRYSLGQQQMKKINVLSKVSLAEIEAAFDSMAMKIRDNLDPTTPQSLLAVAGSPGAQFRLFSRWDKTIGKLLRKERSELFEKGVDPDELFVRRTLIRSLVCSIGCDLGCQFNFVLDAKTQKKLAALLEAQADSPVRNLHDAVLLLLEMPKKDLLRVVDAKQMHGFNQAIDSLQREFGITEPLQKTK